MEYYKLIEFFCVLLALVYFLETISYQFRIIGYAAGEFTFGYSLHSRYNILSRSLLVFILPCLGYLIDTNIFFNNFLRLFILIFIINFFLHCLAVIKFDLSLILLKKIFTDFRFKKKIIIKKKIYYNIFYLATIANIFWMGAITFINLLALRFPEYKSTIIQLTTSLFAIGTLINIYKIDKELSKGIKNLNEIYNKVYSVTMGRLMSSLAILSILFIYYIYKNF